MSIRDAERFKDKIEIRLDNRQIFFLFFGGAVLASLVFVLGVMVGKRLEARDRVAKRAATSAIMDPLAALDELAADEDDADLAFESALVGEGDSAPAMGAVEHAPSVAPPAADSGATPGAKPGKPAKPTKPPKGATAPAAHSDHVSETPSKPVADAREPDDGDGDGDGAASSSGAQPRFTLQLSSFQQREDAEAFTARLAASGYAPYIVRSELPDKGVFYRVRVGRYPNWDDALKAKAEFEKTQHIIAYVTRLSPR